MSARGSTYLWLQAPLLLMALSWWVQASSACSRSSNIYDEPDASLTTNPTLDAGAVVAVADAGLDAFPSCSERPAGACVGANDFPCDFDSWVRDVAANCQALTGCKTNGWLTVAMAAGCVSELSMSEEQPEFVSCLVSSLGPYRCPCDDVSSSIFLGVGHDGCPDAGPIRCGGGEFPCPGSLSCVLGLCVTADGG